MFAAWRVAVVLSAVNMSGPAMNSFINQANQAHNSTTKMKAAIEKLKDTAMVGFAATGVALTALVNHGVNEAARFEKAMVTVGIATGTTGKQLAAMQAQVLQVSSSTAQSASTTADEFAILGRSGFTGKQVKDLAPLFAKYADVQMLSHGTNPVDAIRTAAQLAHQEGAYTSGPVTDMLEMMNKLSFLQPEEMKKVVTQGRYFIPVTRSLGVSEAETMRVSSLMGITGFLGGRGGTSILATLLGALKTPVVTGHLQSAKTSAMARLGLIDAHGKPAFYDDKNQKFMLPQLMEHLSAEAASYKANPKSRGGANFLTDLIAAFGRGPAGFLSAASRPETVQQMKVMDAKMAQIKSIEAQFNDYINTWSGLMQLLGTNITNIFIDVFLPAIKVVEPYVRKLADDMAWVGDYLSKHPGLGVKIAFATVIGAGAAFAASTALAISSIWRLNAAILTLAGAAGASSGVSTAATIAGVASGGKGGMIGKIISAVLGVDLLKSMGGGIGKMLGFGAGKHSGPGFMAQIGNFFKSQAGVGGKHMGSNIFADAFKIFLGDLEFLGPKLLMFAGIFGRIALGVTNVIGWISLLISAFILIKDHGTDIAWLLGNIVGFVQYKLWPGVSSAFSNGIKSLYGIIIGALSVLWSNIISFLTRLKNDPVGTIKGMIQSGGNWVNNIGAAYNAGVNGQKPGAAGANAPSGRGPLRDPGLLQKVEININGTGMNHDQIAKSVVKQLNWHAASAMRSGTGTMVPGIPELGFNGAT